LIIRHWDFDSKHHVISPRRRGETQEHDEQASQYFPPLPKLSDILRATISSFLIY